MKRKMVYIIALSLVLNMTLTVNALTFKGEWGTFHEQKIGNNTYYGTKTVQYLLSLYGENVTIDGSFGTQTKQAVMAYQSDHVLELNYDIDGVVGPKTWKCLYVTMTNLLNHATNSGYNYYMYLPISGTNYLTGYDLRRTNTAWQYKGAHTIQGGF